MPANRAFFVPEVLRYILSELGPILPDQAEGNLELELTASQQGDRRALASVAQCCKGFSVPALDILWSLQTSLLPLLSTLPTFRHKNEHSHRASYTLINLIQKCHWSRFQQYARRIRHLKCNDIAVRDDFVFIQLAQFSKGKPLLPSLPSLSFPMSPPIFLLISPLLRNVHVGAPGDTHLCAGGNVFLQTLLKNAPLLEGFSSSNTDMITHSSILGILTKFQHLRHLSLRTGNDVTFDSLTAILTRLNLSSLSLELSLRSDSPLEKLHTTPLQPLTVRSLSIHAGPSMVHHALLYFAGTPLSALRIKYMDGDTNTIFTDREKGRQHFRTFSHWPESLSTLEIEETGTTQRSSKKLMPLIEPLLKISGMINFTLCMPFISVFSNTDLLRVAMAWPRIQTLKFQHTVHGWHGAMNIVPVPTFTALENFAIHCPNLRELHLHLAACRRRAEVEVTSHRLQSLYIDYPTSGAPHNLAQDIDALFPFLHSVRGRDPKKKVWINRHLYLQREANESSGTK